MIWNDKNKARDGRIVGYNSNNHKHIIEIAAENDSERTEKLEISLKSRQKEKQLIIIESHYKLNNIIFPQNYLKLYLSKHGARADSGVWKPILVNDPNKTERKDKDYAEYHATWKSFRRDMMLRQKVAYAQKDTGEFKGFLKLMIGASYQLQNDKLIVVRDVVCTRGTQHIKYYYLWRFVLL